MTSATFPRTPRRASRRQLRMAAASAALAGTLALTACSGDGDSDGDSADKPSATPSASARASADTGGGNGGGTTSASDELAGSWLATNDGKAVALVINGTQAGLFATGGTVCSGTAGEEAGMRMIHLKCTDGSKDRATGMVDSVDQTTLRVTWSGSLGKETYTKAEGGQLPTGLPTAGLGS